MERPASPLLSAAMMDACAARRTRLGRALEAAGVDGLLLSCEKDIQYTSGFVGHESLALATPQAVFIISDSRYDEYLRPWRDSGTAQVIMGVRHRLYDAVRQVCETHSIRRLGVQAEHMTISGREKLASVVGKDRVVNTSDLVNSLRMRKDAFEVSRIEKAAAIQQDALTAALGQVSIGMTEREFSAVLEFEMKMRGADGAGFTPIIGSGTNSSIIHHTTGGTPIGEGVLLIDWGATVDGFNADLTRTFGIERMPPKLRQVYAVVLEAQQAAIDFISPGKVCADVDAVARNIITKAGYGESFGHGLGHGLGMDVHEAPYFNNLQTDVTLEPGMVMTVEPGIYLPGVGGVRIEDDVLITDDGCRVLSDFPKDLDSMIVEPVMSRT
jgi:Xaa-Pro aminopeptidase